MVLELQQLVISILQANWIIMDIIEAKTSKYPQFASASLCFMIKNWVSLG